MGLFKNLKEGLAGATLLHGAERIETIGEGKPPPRYRYCWPPVA